MFQEVFLVYKALQQHLLTLSGIGFFKDQLEFDPDCEFILEFGRVFDEPKCYIEMAAHRCHWNISQLFTRGCLTDIIIGYALNIEGYWFQHTWGMIDRKIVETSKVNFENIKIYFGAVVNDPSAFADWCAQNPPGKGKVRRIYV